MDEGCSSETQEGGAGFTFFAFLQQQQHSVDMTMKRWSTLTIMPGEHMIAIIGWNCESIQADFNV